MTKYVQILEVNKEKKWVYTAFSSDNNKWTNLQLDLATFEWLTGMYDLSEKDCGFSVEVNTKSSCLAEMVIGIAGRGEISMPPTLEQWKVIVDWARKEKK